MEELNIEEIIEKIRQGDQRIFEALLDRYEQKIFTYVYHMVGHEEDARELTQDIFLRVYAKLDKYKNGTNFNGWLYKIAYNHSISYIRKKSRFKFTSLMPNLLGNGPDAYDWVERKTIHYQLHEALLKLKPHERNIIILRVVEEKSYEEIGFILDKSPIVLRKRYERAKNKLKKYYEEVDLHGKTALLE